MRNHIGLIMILFPISILSTNCFEYGFWIGFLAFIIGAIYSMIIIKLLNLEKLF